VILKVENYGDPFSCKNEDKVRTGAEGRTIRSFILGPEQGRDNIVVAATFDGKADRGTPMVMSGYLGGPRKNKTGWGN
jgi:hypothetical protein